MSIDKYIVVEISIYSCCGIGHFVIDEADILELKPNLLKSVPDTFFQNSCESEIKHK